MSDSEQRAVMPQAATRPEPTGTAAMDVFRDLVHSIKYPDSAGPAESEVES